MRSASSRARATPPTSGETTVISRRSREVVLDVEREDRRRIEVVDRDVEEALDLRGVQIHRQHPLDPRPR